MRWAIRHWLRAITRPMPPKGGSICLIEFRSQRCRFAHLRTGDFHAVCQNSRRAWNATIRGELSPPRPTPNNPVGGAVVDVSAPKPV
jgi:hypothetical protein